MNLYEKERFSAHILSYSKCQYHYFATKGWALCSFNTDETADTLLAFCKQYKSLMSLKDQNITENRFISLLLF